MVKVVGRDETYVPRITCKGCGSILEYNASEIQTFKINWDYLGDYDTVRGIKCPTCETIVKTSKY